MNALVEVEAAKVAVQSKNVTVIAVSVTLEVQAPVASTSPLRVVSISGHSISAVAPDYILEGGLPTAA